MNIQQVRTNAVSNVNHHISNSAKNVNADTGTTFLLGSEGLTVVRRTSVENDYKIHLMQQSSN